MYEGVICEPLIVCWLNKIKKSGTCDVLVIGRDFYPTFLEVVAFLVSAQKKNGCVAEIVVQSEKGGMIKIAKPFKNGLFASAKKDVISGAVIVIEMKVGEIVVLNGVS